MLAVFFGCCPLITDVLGPSIIIGWRLSRYKACCVNSHSLSVAYHTTWARASDDQCMPVRSTSNVLLKWWLGPSPELGLKYTGTRLSGTRCYVSRKLALVTHNDHDVPKLIKSWRRPAVFEVSWKLCMRRSFIKEGASQVSSQGCILFNKIDTV